MNINIQGGITLRYLSTKTILMKSIKKRRNEKRKESIKKIIKLSLFYN